MVQSVRQNLATKHTPQDQQGVTRYKRKVELKAEKWVNTGMNGYEALVLSENVKVPSGHITGNVLWSDRKWG